MAHTFIIALLRIKSMKVWGNYGWSTLLVISISGLDNYYKIAIHAWSHGAKILAYVRHLRANTKKHISGIIPFT